MKIYVVWGQDQIYGGLHGMKEVEVIEAVDDEEAAVYAEELSREVISSYSNIYDQLEEEVKELCEDNEIEYEAGTQEEDDIRYEVYDENLDYGFLELDVSKLPTLDLSELEKMFYKDEEDFIEKYGLD